MQLILHLVPQRGTLQAVLDDFIQFRPAADAVQPRAVGDVVVDALRKWIRPLKDHSHPLADFHHVDPLAEDVLAVQQDFPFGARAGRQVRHPVERSQQRGFSASRRADNGGHAMGWNGQRDSGNGAELPVENGKAANVESSPRGVGFSRRSTCSISEIGRHSRGALWIEILGGLMLIVFILAFVGRITIHNRAAMLMSNTKAISTSAAAHA